MLDIIFKNINKFFTNVLDFLVFRTNNNPVLNNDVENCCLINDGTTIYSE